MAKVTLVPVLFAIACVFAGVYGAVHNQISYTVCHEYFTQFKFHQFRVDREIPERLGAAIVGWKAAWWMGIVIGFVLIPAGLTIQGTSNCFRGLIRAFGVAALTALFFGLAALLTAFFTVDPDSAGQFSRYGNEMVDDAAFARAGAMHNFSYLGGMIGILTGGISICLQRRRQKVAGTIPKVSPPGEGGRQPQFRRRHRR